MKKIFSLATALFLCACGGDDDITPEQVEPKEYIVSLGFTGEITDITQSPLVRTASNDLYGIQVYSKGSSSSSYNLYAYGLFDDISNISIKLLDGYKYKFVSSMVVDGKTKISNNSVGYYYPFCITSESSIITERVPVKSNFIYSVDKYIRYLGSGHSYLSSGTSYNIPNIDRYYGELSDYTPTESGVVNIDMKRTVFGLKVIANGLTKGRLKIALSEAPTSYITYPDTEFNDIFTFYYVSGAYAKDDYSETINFLVSWEKAEDEIIPAISQNITFVRNKLTTVTINLDDNNQSPTSKSVNITNETTPMVDGEGITIDY